LKLLAATVSADQIDCRALDIRVESLEPLVERGNEATVRRDEDRTGLRIIRKGQGNETEFLELAAQQGGMERCRRAPVGAQLFVSTAGAD
jgi:hypothetical protein